MKTELETIILTLRNTLSGKPWFGKPVYTILEEVHPALVYKKPLETGHSMIDLLYHMLTWSEFTLARIRREEEKDMEAFDKKDWRIIDPLEHTWGKGIKNFRNTNDSILGVLEAKSDDWLNEKVDYRDYNFRTLLSGISQHHIYHAGQLAYVSKLLLV
ncbi:MAG TPA: DinB family protein [Flavitalea sp.]|nr:DinB family protein [Flavitalea sp.]